MMLRAVNVAERKRDQPPENLNRVGRLLRQADAENRVDAGRMASVANVTAGDATSFRTLDGAANRAFHLGVFEQVLQRSAANQTFGLRTSVGHSGLLAKKNGREGKSEEKAKNANAASNVEKSAFSAAFGVKKAVGERAKRFNNRKRPLNVDV
jgi:hypothetical protein